MSTPTALRRDPKQRSFWQFDSVRPHHLAGNKDAAPVLMAVFRHTVFSFGVTAPTTDISYPNVRTYTQAELQAIHDAPMKPFRTIKTEAEHKTFEKHRIGTNLAREGLTTSEFARAMQGFHAASTPKPAAVAPSVNMPKPEQKVA